MDREVMFAAATWSSERQCTFSYGLSVMPGCGAAGAVKKSTEVTAKSTVAAGRCSFGCI